MFPLQARGDMMQPHRYQGTNLALNYDQSCSTHLQAVISIHHPAVSACGQEEEERWEESETEHHHLQDCNHGDTCKGTEMSAASALATSQEPDPQRTKRCLGQSAGSLRAAWKVSSCPGEF